MYRDVAQWSSIRRRILQDGVSIRQVARETGISPKTVRKMLDQPLPKPYRPRSRRYPKLGPHIASVQRMVEENATLPPSARMSIKAIYEHIRDQEGFRGSYQIRDGLRAAAGARYQVHLGVHLRFSGLAGEKPRNRFTFPAVPRGSPSRIYPMRGAVFPQCRSGGEHHPEARQARTGAAGRIRVDARRPAKGRSVRTHCAVTSVMFPTSVPCSTASMTDACPIATGP